MRNRNILNESFDQSVVDAVWEKGEIVLDKDPSIYRKDVCGALMKKDNHGELVKTGWEIDHICPKAKGGSDDLSNLQPLQWENNRHKGDNWPEWDCLV